MAVERFRSTRGRKACLAAAGSPETAGALRATALAVAVVWVAETMAEQRERGRECVGGGPFGCAGFKSGFANVEPSLKSVVLSSFVANLGMCCGPVLPMYMPGRFRTGSRPSSTVICSAPYALFCLSGSGAISWTAEQRGLLDRAQRRREEQREVEEDGEREHFILLVVCVPLLCREKRATHGKATVQKGDAEVIELAPLTQPHTRSLSLLDAFFWQNDSTENRTRVSTVLQILPQRGVLTSILSSHTTQPAENCGL